MAEDAKAVLDSRTAIIMGVRRTGARSSAELGPSRYPYPWRSSGVDPGWLSGEALRRDGIWPPTPEVQVPCTNVKVLDD